MGVSAEDFVTGMRQLASGVTLVTTVVEGHRAGLTATAVCSVSADPPRLLVCVNSTAAAHALLRDGGVFAVNILSTGQRDLADRFAGRDGIFGEARFERGVWGQATTGAPVLDGCLAAFDCTVTHTLDVGTHTIFVGAVEAVRLHGAAAPMVYHDGDYGLVARIED